MSSSYLHYLLNRLVRFHEIRTAEIDHQAVMKSLGANVEFSAGYMAAIVLSNLIALLGLLTNSVAVIIGAMLISPLMGPIFTCGLAFTLGDFKLARKATVTIGKSVLMTILVAALLALLSPLKEPTHEILARVRPNIFDLFIAIFAGIAGSAALCTRKNYLITTAGVAVATAVIPPLSVAGYGVGTWHPYIALGGFFLFFTNFVAILLSSDLVFYFFNFRPAMVTQSTITIRRRMQIFAVMLILISGPLVYTLITDLRSIKTSKQIRSILTEELNRPDFSRLTGFSVKKGSRALTVDASINTVRFYDDEKVGKSIEKSLTASLGIPVKLELEQVIVKAGHVEPQFPQVAPLVVKPPPEPRDEGLAPLRDQAMERLKAACAEVAMYLEPAVIIDRELIFSGTGPATGVRLTVARDYPFSEGEEQIIAKMFEKRLGVPVELTINLHPLFTPPTFAPDGSVSKEYQQELARLKGILSSRNNLTVTITAPRKELPRARELTRYLENDLQLPKDKVRVALLVRRSEPQGVKVTVVPR